MLLWFFQTSGLHASVHSIWCGARDSNPHVLSDTATSRLRVYQFRQLRMLLIIILVFVAILNRSFRYSLGRELPVVAAFAHPPYPAHSALWQDANIYRSKKGW